MSSAVMILLGIARNTPPGPLRSRNRLQRKRATPGISYAKSVSWRWANSSRLPGGVIDRRRRSASPAVNGPRPAIVSISPSTRSIGADPVQMWRSDAFRSTIARSRASMSDWAAPLPAASDGAAGAADEGAGAGGCGSGAAALPPGQLDRGLALRASNGERPCGDPGVLDQQPSRALRAGDFHR